MSKPSWSVVLHTHSRPCGSVTYLMVSLQAHSHSWTGWKAKGRWLWVAGDHLISLFAPIDRCLMRGNHVGGPEYSAGWEPCLLIATQISKVCSSLGTVVTYSSTSWTSFSDMTLLAPLWGLKYDINLTHPWATFIIRKIDSSSWSALAERVCLGPRAVLGKTWSLQPSPRSEKEQLRGRMSGISKGGWSGFLGLSTAPTSKCGGGHSSFLKEELEGEESKVRQQLLYEAGKEIPGSISSEILLLVFALALIRCWINMMW